MINNNWQEMENLQEVKFKSENELEKFMLNNSEHPETLSQSSSFDLYLKNASFELRGRRFECIEIKLQEI